MVNVILKLMTIFSTDVGLSELVYSNVSTLGEIINRFMVEYGKRLRKSFVDTSGMLQSHIVILVNGRNYLFLDGLNTKLKDGDQIVISPPLSGG